MHNMAMKQEPAAEGLQMHMKNELTSPDAMHRKIALSCFVPQD